MKDNKSMIKKIISLIFAVVIVVVMIFVGQLPTFVLGHFEPIFNKQNNLISSILFVCWLLMFMGIIWFVWGYYQKKSDDLDTKISGKDVWRAFKIFLVGRLIAIIGTGLMQQLYGNGTSANDNEIMALFGPEKSIYFVLIMTISVAIGAPILEELTFRGLPTALIFKNTPKWIPMIVTSLAFSGVHLSSNIISFAMYASLGALMYWAYSSRGRIIDSMLVHFFNNIFGAIALLLSYFVG